MYMAVLKNKTQGNYTIVSQNIMRDSNLSLNERGMLLTLLSLPDNWHLTIRGLCQILPDGKDKISKTLNSLIEKGYVTREQGRNNGGRFDSTDLEVHESPVLADDHDGNGESDDLHEEDIQPESDLPCPENPDTVKRDAVKPYTENPPQYSNNISNNHKVNNKGVCMQDTLSDSEYADLVSEFGQPTVDYQIKRIKEHNYRGCYNFETINAWCLERLNRPVGNAKSKPKQNVFNSYQQRPDCDYDKLVRSLTRP